VTLPLLLAALPCLYWAGPVEGAAPIRAAKVEPLCVPPEQAEAWSKAGFKATPLAPSELKSRDALATPGLRPRGAGRAGPTRSPWVFTNGARFLRQPDGRFAYELPAGRATLAAAEAFAYQADAVLQADPADLEALGRMYAFLRELPPRELADVADVAVVDDGSPLLAESLNLLVRRNVLFRIAKQPVPQLRVTVKLGTPEYPQGDAADPSALALKIRRQLGDEQRSLRIFGSEVVIGRLTGDATRLRLHLLNYGGREIEGLRVRLRGSFVEDAAWASGPGRVALEDVTRTEGATEFSLPRLETYAVIDLVVPSKN
jgi:hypothetical protein